MLKTDSAETFGDKLRRVVGNDASLRARLSAVQQFGRRVRTTEYHVTNACNLRCDGCWFFAHDFHKASAEERSIDAWEAFAAREAKERSVTAALLIGGEPTLFPERVRAFMRHMPYVTVSTNGVEPLPREGFENVAISVTLFGGGPLDDELRGVKPSGKRIQGLLTKALGHYRDDPRVVFLFAITEEGIEHVRPTVDAIVANGNRVGFNYYRKYGTGEIRRKDGLTPSSRRLLDTALAVQAEYGDRFVSHPLHLEAMVTGKTFFGTFGFDVCPSVSENHPANAARLQNGNPALPRFRVYAPDLATVNTCCTSGHCDDCRDATAVQSWLMVSFKHFLESRERLVQWLDIAEAYWSAFVWSPWHPSNRERPGPQAGLVTAPSTHAS